eukprot:TRINITY_DN4840_c0_g1_i2.p1 TRINITY_DN4840_c0_g1~~TRINITY_DN4840_c0_g1_i2.p1  ORF type:complete len:1104 (+),score=324.60 TRINITY_DN4840_c0_g1_i2:563-3874(+)
MVQRILPAPVFAHPEVQTVQYLWCFMQQIICLSLIPCFGFKRQTKEFFMAACGIFRGLSSHYFYKFTIIGSQYTPNQSQDQSGNLRPQGLARLVQQPLSPCSYHFTAFSWQLYNPNILQAAREAHLARPLVELNRIFEEFRPILARKAAPNRQGRALISTVGGLLDASGGAICVWERGGQLILSATWGLPPAEARRLRTLSQNTPACPGEPLGRIGWVVLEPGGRVDGSGWPQFDRLLTALAENQHLALWPLARPLGSGMALLRFKAAPQWGKDFAQAVSNVLASAVQSVLLQSQVSHRQGDYSRIFANSRDMIYLSTRDGRWVDVNPAGVEMLGYDSVEQLLSTPDSAQKAYLNPKDRQAFRAAIEKDGFVKDYEVSFQKRDGTPIEVAITASVRERDGTVVGYEGIIKDITASKRAQAQAQAEHRLVASILEVMPVAIFVVDRDHKVMHWNKACEELTGWPRERIMGTDQVWKVFNRPKGVSLADVVVDDDPVRLRTIYGKENLRPSPLAPEAWEAEKFFQNLGGKPRQLFFTAAALRDKQGRVTGAVEAILDTTDIMELQRKLAESEALYRTLVESNREGIVLHDYQRFVFANHSFLECFGLERLEQAGSDFLELLADSCRRQYLEWMRSVERGSGAQVFEGQGIRPDGLFDLEVTATPCPYQGSSAILFTTRDVTTRKSMEEQLIRSERLAATGKLAFDIAHEVNNPLGGILTYAHLLQEDMKGQDDLAPTVDKIIKLTNRCKIIVRGLLDFARQDTPEKEPMDINRVLLEVLSLMEGHMILRRVDIQQELQHHLPVLWGQRAKLEQVFLNMLINAAEAMEGKGELRLSTHWDEAKGQVLVVFQDNGPGMEEEVVRRIFEPFFTTKPRGRGTGLGLAISHGIIQQHGGEVKVKTAPGRGCTFTITLPVNDAQVPRETWAHPGGPDAPIIQQVSRETFVIRFQLRQIAIMRGCLPGLRVYSTTSSPRFRASSASLRERGSRTAPPGARQGRARAREPGMSVTARRGTVLKRSFSKSSPALPCTDRTRPARPRLRTACFWKETRLARGSSRVTWRSGRARASTRPGKPAPEPISNRVSPWRWGTRARESRNRSSQAAAVSR